MVRASGYLQTLDDFRAIPLRTAAGGVPVTLGDVATIQLGPEMRRGIAELDGDGEVAGGVVILRSGSDARATIQAVQDKLELLKKSLPRGVAIVPTYDRSHLIDAAIENLTHKLAEEFVVVAIVCALFLWHALGACRDRHAAAWRPRRLHRDAFPGRQRQHHVLGRDRDRDRRHGRRRDRDDRERPQADRAMGA
jgi:hypothetical protein